MKFEFELVKTTSKSENQSIIYDCIMSLNKIHSIAEAFEIIKKILKNHFLFECGKGGNHIWIGNIRDERLICITE